LGQRSNGKTLSGSGFGREVKYDGEDSERAADDGAIPHGNIKHQIHSVGFNSHLTRQKIK